jgi:hypothetical protein
MKWSLWENQGSGNRDQIGATAFWIFLDQALCPQAAAAMQNGRLGSVIPETL